MSIKNKFIPNPNKISKVEQEFINNSSISEKPNDKEIYRGRMISMPDSFFKKLNDFLRKNPTEGNRSSFIVRIVAEHMDGKAHKTQE